MGKLSVTIQNRTYRLTCGDGEDARLAQLVDHVREKADQLTAEHGRISEQHLLLMTALLVADELFDAREAGVAKATPPIEEPETSRRGKRTCKNDQSASDADAAP